MSQELIVALDTEDIEKAERLIIKLKNQVNIFKIGHILFARYGSLVIDLLTKNKCKVFLDLKLLDIPHVVASAIKYFTEKQVYMCTVSILGGKEMVKATTLVAQQTANELNISKPIILGVGILTSLDKDNLKELGINKSVLVEALLLTKQALSWGCDGVILPPNLVKKIRKAINRKFIIVSPGIRDKIDKNAAEHKNFTFIKKISAIDYIVVGRPIIEAEEPQERLKDFLRCRFVN